MADRLIAITLGSPVRFSDRWQGTAIALEVDETWEVLNVLVSRGILRWKRSVKLPFSACHDWNDAHMSFDCTSGQAFAREIPPVAAPARQLSTKTPLSLPQARLVGILVGEPKRLVSTLLIRERRQAKARREVPVNEARFEGKTLVVLGQADSLATYQSDGEIHAAVRLAFNDRTDLKPADRSAITIEVLGAVVSLRGNVRTKAASELAGHMARSVEGVVAVKNEAIDDTTLESALGQLLERSGQRRSRARRRSPAGDIMRTISQAVGVRAVKSRLEVRAAEATSIR